jgi:hypothetical protein
LDERKQQEVIRKGVLMMLVAVKLIAQANKQTKMK